MSGTYQVLPDLSVEDFDRLKADIVEHGVEVPVLVDEDGQIIDGHHRAMIADSLGMEYPKEVRRGLSDAEKRSLALRVNLDRRHLTDAQRALLGMELEPEIAKEVSEKAHSRTWEVRSGSTSPIGDVDPGRPRNTGARVAEAVGLGSENTYFRHKRALTEAMAVDPSLVERARRGEVEMAAVRRAVGRHGRTGQRKRTPAADTSVSPTPKPIPRANVGPEIRRVLDRVHDATQRVRLIRSRHQIGRLAVGVEGEVLAREVGALRDELDGFARELGEAVAQQQRSG